MKLFFNQNLSFKLVEKLRDVFPDSHQARRAGLDRADDRQIWEYAQRHGYVLVTYDADFAERSALLGHPPKVIWLRCGNQPCATVEALLRRNATAIEQFAQDPQTGCLELYW